MPTPTSPSMSSGVTSPAGVPNPLIGLTAPLCIALGGTGILIPSGLAGTILCDKPSM